MILGDLMIFDLKSLQWSFIAQQGFMPSPRWGAALAYSQDLEQIFVFGGMNLT